jgi:hypothetical protein
MPLEREQSHRVLDPFERFAETIFGLIMVLTFTGGLSVATAGRQEVRTMLIGAIGCNTAWGIIDAVLYIVGGFLWRGRGIVILKAIRQPGNQERARELISEALPDSLVSALSPADLDLLRERLNAQPEPPARPPITKRDFLGALAVFLLVFLSTFPVVLPFLFMSDAGRALRLSNWIAVALLFLSGFLLGRYTGLRPVRLGLAMAVLGAILVSLTIALGG